jgi:hypothetical protein
MTAKCKDGHDSTELDYCSVCGAAMGPPGASAGAPAGAHAPNACPDCGEPRIDPNARYCEVCRFDFVARHAGPPPAAPKPAAPAAPSPAPPPVPRRADPDTWEVVVLVDPTLDTDPDPETPCPTGAPEHVFPLDLPEMLVGRRDDTRDIRPEIPVSDPGTSRRHAKLLKSADGKVALLDLASMNGTCLNGVAVAPGSRHPLKEGDEVTLGRWTRLRLRGRS